MAFSTKTKWKAAGVAGTGLVIAIFAGEGKSSRDHPYVPTLAQEATDALHHGGKGFSTLFLEKQEMAKPITEAVINQSVEIMLTGMGDRSPQARALGECSIALANDLWRVGTGKVRQHILAETAAFSFENGATNMPPTLGAECHRVNVELLADKSAPFFPVPVPPSQ